MEQLIPLDIGQELKKLRVMQKFEQSDVGLYIGVSDRTVRNIEKGAFGTKTATVLLGKLRLSYQYEIITVQST